MSWIKTKTDAEAKALDDAMWRLVWTAQDDGTIEGRVPGLKEEDGKFWYDRIKEIRDNPELRLVMAKRHLPLPAAWRELALAHRAIIRQKRRAGSDISENLCELYHFAAMWSFYLPYSEVLQEPGYNVFAQVPFEKIFNFDLRWNRIGCDKLELLTKTDRKQMRELWGEPQNHTTANVLYSHVWCEYELHLKEVRENYDREFIDSFMCENKINAFVKLRKLGRYIYSIFSKK